MRKVNKRVVCYLLSFVNAICPKKKNMIFLYDSTFTGFNIMALTRHMINNNINDEYILVYFTKNRRKAKAKYGNHRNITITSNPIIALCGRIISKYVICEYTNYAMALKTTDQQVCISLWHGMGLKAIGYQSPRTMGYNPYSLRDTFSYQLCYSEFAKKIMQESFRFSDDQTLISQNPRVDLMFTKKDIWSSFNIERKYQKIIMWLPTFRNSDSTGFYDSEVDFPLLNSANMESLENTLRNNNVLLVIKLHPLQRKIEFLTNEHEFIRILETSDFDDTDVEFYEFLGQMDALLSDYSSVYYDYLLLDRPIGFVIDDYDDYAKKRGFNVDNPLEMMPGHHITTFHELESFIHDVANGKDAYSDDRKRVNDLVNQYQDANNCERVLSFVGIIPKKSGVTP